MNSIEGRHVSKENPRQKLDGALIFMLQITETLVAAQIAKRKISSQHEENYEDHVYDIKRSNYYNLSEKKPCTVKLIN